MSEPVIIDRRFRGPPASANGGYTCGVLATAIYARDGEPVAWAEALWIELRDPA